MNDEDGRSELIMASRSTLNVACMTELTCWCALDEMTETKVSVGGTGVCPCSSPSLRDSTLLTGLTRFTDKCTTYYGRRIKL